MTGPAPPGDDRVPDLTAVLGDDANGELRHLAQEHHPTDTGNAYRFMRICGSVVRYDADRRGWLVWDGKRFEPDVKGRALDLTRLVCEDVRAYAFTVTDENERGRWRAWADASESVSRRKAVIELAATLPDLVKKNDDLAAEAHLLNTPSGVVNLITGEVSEHDPDLGIYRITNASYHPDVAWSPLLRNFQETFVPDIADWHYVMKFFGSFLHGRNHFRVWAILHGASSTGKTQLIETIASVLGDYASSVSTSVFRANLDERARPDLVGALDKRFAYAMEGSHAWELHSDHVKLLTGMDPVTARTLYSPTVLHRIPDFTPLIVCNQYPRVRGVADQAIKRRLRVIEFDRSVLGNEDQRVRDVFTQDDATRTALLSQLVLGCRRAYAEGLDVDLPARFAEATLDAFGELTNVQDFLTWLTAEGRLQELTHNDSLHMFNSHFWKATDLYYEYDYWVARHGSAEDRRGLLGLKQFNAELRALGWWTVLSQGTRWVGKLNTTAPSDL